MDQPRTCKMDARYIWTALAMRHWSVLAEFAHTSNILLWLMEHRREGTSKTNCQSKESHEEVWIE